MSTSRTEATEEPEDKQRATFDAADETLTKTLLRRVRDGSVPILVGAVLFAVAAGQRRRGGDASRPALAAVALVALGLLRRRSSVGLSAAADARLRDGATGNEVSDEAHAAAARNETSGRPEANVERGDEPASDDESPESDDGSSSEREW